MYPQLSKRLLYLEGCENFVSTLFVLEAPFDKEIQGNCPCVGASGESMSKALFGSDFRESLGAVLNGSVETIPNEAKKYAVFDTFKFPIDTVVADKLGMGLRDLLSPDNVQWTKIKICDKKIGGELKREAKLTGRYDRFCHYETLIQCIQSVDSSILKEFINGYKADLSRAMALFRNLENIVVCGFIAQSVLCCVCQKDYREISYRVNYIIPQKRINLRFVEHPINAHKRDDEPLWLYLAKDPPPRYLR